MGGPAAELRRVTLNALTEVGWIAGSVHIPGQIKLADFLYRASDFLALTEVFMESHANVIPFFALQQGAIHLITSDELEAQQTPDEAVLAEQHEISCMFSMGRLKGTIGTKPGVRLSDILARHKNFVAVSNCTYEIRSPRTRKIFREERPQILLNCGRIIGISELGSGE